MDYKKVIVDSWIYTQSNKKLIFWFGFIPSLLTTTVGIFTIAYQIFAFKKSYIFGDEQGSALKEVTSFIWDFINTHISWTVPMIVFVAIFGILYFLFPTLARAASVQIIARHRNGQEDSIGTGVKYGIMSFLQLFEYHMIIKTFSFFSLLIEMSFVVRNLGPVLFKLLLPVFFLLIIVSFVLILIFTYTDFFIVIDGKEVFESMKASAKLVILSWKHTVLITILMILIGVRIFIQAIMVFAIPALIIGITGYVATVTLAITGLLIGGIVGIICLFLASYLNGVIDIFSYTVWTYTFLDLTSEKHLSAREVVTE
ncbi:hypothetical protein COY05_04530 [Candidatus Peregrinibacteria bacterium CG_4_10_14_0_2_um_filter_38_24]|nr:MAG: hypothetical protein COY05_04530 [Candidatus Peregrinibacteria bacterium CG_4_10_14_0_2_um_filter_38_24]